MHKTSLHIREAEILIWFILGVYVGVNLGAFFMGMFYFAKSNGPEVSFEQYRC